jgi:hypothetical protein
MSRVYYGTIVNPVNADTVDILIDALLAVDANGVIAWLEPNVPPSSLQDKLAHHGWLDQDLIELTRWEWLMPGFIDTHTVGGRCMYGFGLLITAAPSTPRSFPISDCPSNFYIYNRLIVFAGDSSTNFLTGFPMSPFHARLALQISSMLAKRIAR